MRGEIPKKKLVAPTPIRKQCRPLSQALAPWPQAARGRLRGCGKGRRSPGAKVCSSETEDATQAGSNDGPKDCEVAQY